MNSPSVSDLGRRLGESAGHIWVWVKWTVAWEVEVTDEFKAWWNGLNKAEQLSVGMIVVLLSEEGPTLGFPHSSKVARSRHSAMRELRIQHQGRPYRVLYMFDPRRMAILLLGGDKTQYCSLNFRGAGCRAC